MSALASVMRVTPETRRVVTRDGVESALRIFRAPAARSAASLVIVPAMGVVAAYYTPFAEALCRAGHNVAVAELRGHGTSSVRASRFHDFGYWDILAKDLPAVVARVREELDPAPLALVGHSLGGQVSLLALARAPRLADGLAMIASAPPDYRGWSFPQNLGILAGTQVASAVAHAVGHFPGRRFKFAGREARGVMGDWARAARTGKYEIARAKVNLDSEIANLTHPVFALSLEGDSFAPKSAVDRLCARLGHAELARVHYDARAHERLGIDHFRWVKQPADIVTHLADWSSRAFATSRAHAPAD